MKIKITSRSNSFVSSDLGEFKPGETKTIDVPTGQLGPISSALDKLMSRGLLSYVVVDDTSLPDDLELATKADLSTALASYSNIVRTSNVTPYALKSDNPQIFNVRDYGAKGDNTTDDWAAVKAAIDAACNSPNGGTVYFPAGTYLIKRWDNFYAALRVWKPKVHLAGAGRDFTLINLGLSRSLIMVAERAPTKVPHSPDLFGDASKRSLDFSTGMTVIVSETLGKAHLHGLGQLNIKFKYKPLANTDFYNIISSQGAETGDGSNDPDRAFRVRHMAGAMKFFIRTTAGDVEIASPNVMVPNTAYHVECTWTGSMMYLFIDGVLRASAAQTGTIVQKKSENATIGGDYRLIHEQITWFGGPYGHVSQIQVRNVAGNTANYTAPTAGHNAYEAGTLFYYGGEATTGVDDIDDYYIQSINPFAKFYRVTRPDNQLPAGYMAPNCISDMTIYNGSVGVSARRCPGFRMENVTVQYCSESGIELFDNCYESKLYEVKVIGGSTANIDIRRQAGLTYIQNFRGTGGGMGVLMTGAGVLLENPFHDSSPGTRCAIYASGTGDSWSGLTIVGGALGDEGGSDSTYTNIILEDLRSALFVGVGVTNLGGSGKLLAASAGQRKAGFPVTFVNGDWARLVATGGPPVQVINGVDQSTIWSKGRITLRDVNFYGNNLDPSAPLGTSPGVVSTTYAGKVTNVTGISATDTMANNLRGQVIISGTSTSATVTFATQEVDAAYYIDFGAGVSSGTPVAGSFSPSWTNKTATGFTINLNAAPGVGNAVAVDWKLTR